LDGGKKSREYFLGLTEDSNQEPNRIEPREADAAGILGLACVHHGDCVEIHFPLMPKGAFAAATAPGFLQLAMDVRVGHEDFSANGLLKFFVEQLDLVKQRRAGGWARTHANRSSLGSSTRDLAHGHHRQFDAGCGHGRAIVVANPGCLTSVFVVGVLLPTLLVCVE
jgi:hypothetical protein